MRENTNTACYHTSATFPQCLCCPRRTRSLITHHAKLKISSCTQPRGKRELAGPRPPQSDRPTKSFTSCSRAQKHHGSGQGDIQRELTRSRQHEHSLPRYLHVSHTWRMFCLNSVIEAEASHQSQPLQLIHHNHHPHLPQTRPKRRKITSSTSTRPTRCVSFRLQCGCGPRSTALGTSSRPARRWTRGPCGGQAAARGRSRP